MVVVGVVVVVAAAPLRTGGSRLEGRAWGGLGKDLHLGLRGQTLDDANSPLLSPDLFLASTNAISSFEWD